MSHRDQWVFGVCSSCAQSVKKKSTFYKHANCKAQAWAGLGWLRKGHDWVAGGSRVGRRGRWVVGGLASPSFFVLTGRNRRRTTETTETTETTFRAYPGRDNAQGKISCAAPLTLIFVTLTDTVSTATRKLQRCSFLFN